MGMSVRAAAVAATAAAGLLVTGTVAVAAAEGEETISACVQKSSGQLRLLMDGSTACRSSEVLVQWADASSALHALAEADAAVNEPGDPVHWTKLQGVPEDVLGDHGLADFISSLELSGSDAEVHWDNLTHVPPALVDGEIWFDELAGGLTSQMLIGLVDGSSIIDGTVTAHDLAGMYVNGEEVVLGGVTGEKIRDRSIEGRDVADRSIGAAQLDLVHQSATGAGGTAGGTGQQVMAVSQSVARHGSYFAAGQAQLSLVSGGTTSVDVHYGLFDGAALISPEYVSSLSPSAPSAVASVSALSELAAARTVELRVWLEGAAPEAAVTVSSAALHLHEVG